MGLGTEHHAAVAVVGYYTKLGKMQKLDFFFYSCCWQGQDVYITVKTRHLTAAACERKKEAVAVLRCNEPLGAVLYRLSDYCKQRLALALSWMLTCSGTAR